MTGCPGSILVFSGRVWQTSLDIADSYTNNSKHILCHVGVVYSVHILVEEHSKVLPLLSSLIHTELFNQAGVWLKHAECLHALNDLEQA